MFFVKLVVSMIPRRFVEIACFRTCNEYSGNMFSRAPQATRSTFTECLEGKLVKPVIVQPDDKRISHKSKEIVKERKFEDGVNVDIDMVDQQERAKNSDDKE